MKLDTRHTLLRPALICGSLMLILLLAACGTSGSGGTTVIPTPTPTPTPAPALTTYTGQGYTIGYPKGWTSKKLNGQSLPTTTFLGNYISSLSHVVGQVGQAVPVTTFSDSLGTNTLTVGTLPNPNGVIPPQTALSVATTAFRPTVKNYKQAAIASQATVGGQAWNQTAVTGTITQAGSIDAQIVALVSNHPAQSMNTKLYFVVYAGPASTFATTDSTAFQPMLQSFKFA
jgi:hypothetical protein